MKKAIKKEINSSLSNTVKFLIKKTKEQCLKFNINYNKDNFTFMIEDINDPTIKLYELDITFEELKKLNSDFSLFKTTDKFISVIKNCIEKEFYSLEYDENENGNFICLTLKYDLFEGIARIQIPEKKSNKELINKIEFLNETINELMSLKYKDKMKEDAACNSFKGTAFLNNDDKILISKWIHPEKVIKFNLLFSTNMDGTSSSSTFHYYCDGVFPTVTVIYDTSGRKFGGYCTHSWSQSPVGSNYCRAPGSFIFNLSNRNKYELVDEYKFAIYKNTSYGPTFGYSNYDLYLANSCTSNSSSYCYYSSSSAYKTGNQNLLGGSGQTSFQVSYYEVYQVIFE